MPTATVLFSGGLDSTFLIWYLRRIGFNVNAAFMHKTPTNTHDDEVFLNSLRMVEKLTGRSIPVTHLQYTALTKKSGQEVGRHLMFAGAVVPALVNMKSTHLALGVYDDAEGFIDTRPEFIEAMNVLFRKSDVPVSMLTMHPFANKLEVLKTLKDLNLLEKFVTTTEWCYKRSRAIFHWPTGARGCGTCKSCKIMARALKDLCEGEVC